MPVGSALGGGAGTPMLSVHAKALRIAVYPEGLAPQAVNFNKWAHMPRPARYARL